MIEDLFYITKEEMDFRDMLEGEFKPWEALKKLADDHPRNGEWAAWEL